MRSLFGQFGLHRLKEFTLQQRWLWTRVDLVFVTDFANVEPIAQHVEERALCEGEPTTHFARR